MDRESYSSIPIGGCLLYFCFTAIVSGPLFLLRFTLKLHQPLNIATYFGLITLSVVVGLLVWFLSQLAFPALWLESSARIIHCAVAFIAGRNLSARGLQQGFISQMSAIFGAAIIVAWLVYFKRSKRVLHTFGRNL
jgi:hypothetical protein